MSGLDKDRKRNQTIAFRMTPEERQELEARIKVKYQYASTLVIDTLYYIEVKVSTF